MELSQEEIYVRQQLEELYPQLLINAKKTCGAAFDKHGLDLLSVAIEFFLTKPIEVQVKAFRERKAENFITFIMGTQLKSSTTRFYQLYRRHHESQRELYDNYDYGYEYVSYNDAFEDEPSELMECIHCEVEKLDPYLRMLVKEKIMGDKKYTEIEDLYHINYGALKRDKEKVLNQIREKCKNYL